MHFLTLVVVLVFSFCAFYVVCPVNHTSQKIIVSWYRLNFISLLSQETQFICISTSIFKCNLFFLDLLRYLHMLYYSAVPSLSSSQKEDSFTAATLLFLEMFFSFLPCIHCFFCLSVRDAHVKCFALCHFAHSFPNDTHFFPA